MYTKQFLPELQLRWQKIDNELVAAQADALLVSSNANLYYTAGRVINGYIYLERGCAPLFFVRRPMGLVGEGVCYIRKPEQLVELLAVNGRTLPSKLLLEGDTMPQAEYARFARIFADAEIGNGSSLLRAARTIKTPYEQELLRESGVKHVALYKHIPALYEEGMSDIELSIEIERKARMMGSLGIFRIFGSSMEIFMGSLLVGDNADTPSPYDFALGGGGLDNSIPVGSNGTIISPTHAVMVDMGGNFTGYISDMTRTFSVGMLPDMAERAHQLSINITAAIEKVAKPGVAVANLYNIALDMATQAGFAPHFMGHKQQAGFVGHGIGIEINEAPVLAPRSRDVLAEGMAFALEPKFVIPHVGAVGVENSYLVTADGVEKLTDGAEEIVSLRY